MTDKDKIKALISMLLAFRHVHHLTGEIDKKLAEICPEETEQVKAMIHEGIPSSRPN